MDIASFICCEPSDTQQSKRPRVFQTQVEEPKKNCFEFGREKATRRVKKNNWIGKTFPHEMWMQRKSEQTMKMVGVIIGVAREMCVCKSETERAMERVKKFHRKLQAHVMHARRYRFVL